MNVEEGGKFVKWLNNNRQLLIAAVANIIGVVISMGIFALDPKQAQEYAAQIVGAVLVIVNAVAYVVEQVIKNNANKNKGTDAKAGNETGDSTDVG